MGGTEEEQLGILLVLCVGVFLLVGIYFGGIDFFMPDSFSLSHNIPRVRREYEAKLAGKNQDMSELGQSQEGVSPQSKMTLQSKGDLLAASCDFDDEAKSPGPLIKKQNSLGAVEIYNNGRKHSSA